jgi:cell division septum initiation protein DivIVA
MIYSIQGESMPRGRSDQNRDILEYALQHLERERDELQSRIDVIRRQLGGRAVSSSSNNSAPPAAASAAPRKKRTLSEAARKRIAAAQKRRWAEHRRQLKSKSAGE